MPRISRAEQGRVVAAFRAQGGKIYAVYTGRRSRAMMGASPDAIDAMDCDIPIDRVLILARDERGFAGCVVTPLLDSDNESTYTSDTTGSNLDLYDTVSVVVGFDAGRTRVAYDALSKESVVEPPSWRRLVADAAHTAVRRLKKHGPMDLAADCTAREAAVRALGHMDRPGALPHLRKDRENEHHKHVDQAPSSVSTDRTKARVGADNDLTALVALRREFEAKGGRLVLYHTARARSRVPVPKFIKADGFRRSVVIAVKADGTAGAAVWRARETDVTRAGNARRVCRDLRRANLSGLILEPIPAFYEPFDFMAHVGTAIRRCQSRPYVADPTASDEALAAQVLAHDYPVVRGASAPATPTRA
jgi:hypothetical protein